MLTGCQGGLIVGMVRERKLFCTEDCSPRSAAAAESGQDLSVLGDVDFNVIRQLLDLALQLGDFILNRTHDDLSGQLFVFYLASSFANGPVELCA